MSAPSHEPADELLIRIWRVLSRVAVPVMMAMAYTLLVATSDVEAKGAFWMGFGFVLVMIAWVVFRKLTDAAALSRALSVGDVVKLDELGARPQSKFAVARALAAVLRGDVAMASTAAADAARFAELGALIEMLRVVARLEQGAPSALVEAAPALVRVTDDVRAGGLARAIAHRYLARIADAERDAARAAKHRGAVESLAVPEATWLRTP